MGKKKTMSMASFSKSAWPWPSCKQQPRTSSFRGGQELLQVRKVVSSADIDPTPDSVQSPFSCFTNSSECPSFSGESVESSTDSAEVVLGGLQSDRLFFEPKGVSKSMVEEGEDELVLEEGAYNSKESCVVMAMESNDPYKDFKCSMEEMVQAHELKDQWECLEELLLWYLRMNGKEMQRYIVSAFVDLLVDIVASNLESSSTDQDSSISDSSFDHQEDNKFLEG